MRVITRKGASCDVCRSSLRPKILAPPPLFAFRRLAMAPKRTPAREFNIRASLTRLVNVVHELMDEGGLVDGRGALAHPCALGVERPPRRPHQCSHSPAPPVAVQHDPARLTARRIPALSCSDRWWSKAWRSSLSWSASRCPARLSSGALLVHQAP